VARSLRGVQGSPARSGGRPAATPFQGGCRHSSFRRCYMFGTRETLIPTGGIRESGQRVRWEPKPPQCLFGGSHDPIGNPPATAPGGFYVSTLIELLGDSRPDLESGMTSSAHGQLTGLRNPPPAWASFHSGMARSAWRSTCGQDLRATSKVAMSWVISTQLMPALLSLPDWVVTQYKPPFSGAGLAGIEPRRLCFHVAAFGKVISGRWESAPYVSFRWFLGPNWKPPGLTRGFHCVSSVCFAAMGLPSWRS
jgi:hypothetical protein